ARLLAAVAGLACIAAPAVYAAPQLAARLTRSSITLGDATALEVVVSGAPLRVDKPEFAMPEDVEILGNAQSPNVAWENGQGTNVITFRYELGARRAGNFTLGPFRVQAGGVRLEAPALTLSVTTSLNRVGGAATPGSGAASLVVDVTPNDPWVGQPVM